MLDAEYPQARGVRLRCVSAPTGPQTTSMCSVSCRGIYHKMRSELWWTFVTHPGDSPLLNPFLSLRLKSYTYLVPGCAPSAGGNGGMQASAGRARWAGAHPPWVPGGLAGHHRAAPGLVRTALAADAYIYVYSIVDLAQT